MFRATRELGPGLRAAATLAMVLCCLAVTDASGRPVAGLTLGGQQELAGSNTLAGDDLGRAVALSGDGQTALVGAPGRDSGAGAVYVFTRSGTSWVQEQELTAADAAPGDRFGGSVALSSDGSTALIGADARASATGAAYVFVRSVTTWTQQQELAAPDGAPGDRLGGSVALSGDGSTALIGADAGGGGAGAAYVFSRSDTTWARQQTLTASDGGAGDRFGSSVALAGDASTGLIGAEAHGSGAGAGYVFTRSGAVWAQAQELTASDASGGDGFGVAAALSADGSTALIGAALRGSGAGAAYAFTDTGATWAQEQVLTPSDGAAGDAFGGSVALSGDGSEALIGATGRDSVTGAAYVFTGSGASFTERQTLTAADGSAGDDLGVSVALPSDGTTALAGADIKDAAYAFAEPIPTATALHSSEDPSAVGDEVTYTATVSPTPAGGTIAFTQGGTAITGCDAAGLDANGTATCRTTYADVGSHDITAAYSGDSDHRASASAAVTQTVGMAATATELASSADPSDAGGEVAYIATVSPSPDGGTVTFTEGGAAITGCDSTGLDGNGTATCRTTYANVGSHAVTATYSGDGNFAGSVSTPLTQTVGTTATGTILASSADPSESGRQVTFTATVSPTPDGGTVAFTDDGAGIPGCGAAAVDTFTGLATCQTSYANMASHAIGGVYSGDADYGTSAASPLTQTVGAAATATVLASLADPSAVGDQVTYTASVSPTPGGGSVAFADGGTTIPGCAAAVVDGNGQATCQTTYPATGDHAITATYSGDSDDGSSNSSPLTQTVIQAATATALTSSANASEAGRQVTFTASVSPSPDSGAVTFTDPGTGIAISGCESVATDGNGRATCRVTFADAGTQVVAAAYAGDPNYESSASAPLTQVVDRAVTATTVSSGANPATVGQQVTYTASVSPTPDSGTLAFTDGVAAIAGCDAVPVDGHGNASCQATYQAIGSRSIAAAYSGDPNDLGSTSSPLSQTVSRTATATAISSSNGTSMAGEQVTFTATVSPVPDTGTIAFTDTGTAVTGCGSVGVDPDGRATCRTTYSGAGDHAITATYSGGGSFEDSASSVLTQTVGRATTATALSSDTNPSAAGGRVTYTATVSPAPGAGTIAFTDAGAGIAGCDAVAVGGNGAAVCAVTYAGAATHDVAAAYSGDADLQASGSNALAQTVTPAPTATTVRSSANPSAVGAQVTFTANVAPVPDAGTVAFTHAGGAIAGCGDARVGGAGNATCQITYSAVGAHTVTATYSGDPDHLTSASTPLAQTVTPARTTTVVASSVNPSAVGGAVTYTATVSPVPAGGTMAFTDGGAIIPGCDAVAIAGNGNATCPATYAAIGSHPVTATYSGDTGYGGSASPALTQTVGPAATAATLASSADTTQVGLQVTFTATVTPIPDGGSIHFADAGGTITGCGAVGVDGNGRATCQTTYAQAGAHAITALYSGDADYQGSGSIALGQTVGQATTSTALESSSDPSAVGDTVAYTVTVSPAPDGGTVAFTDNGASVPGCGAVAVDRNGAGTCPAAYSGVSSHPITARYSGDSNYQGSVSVTLTQSVDIIPSGTALASSANPATAGQLITFTATVTPTPGGGTIAFTDGGAAITGCGAVAVDGSGQATCQTTYPAVGSRAIVAVYSGDATDQGSTSFTLTQTVAQATTATTLASSSDPSAVGDQVTYTANVSPTPTGGTVAFTDAGTTIAGCATVAVGANGNAICPAAYTAVGAHPVTATYAGTASYQGSESSPVIQTVGQAATAVGLRSSGDPSAIGDLVTYTANVSPTPDGGTVAFTDAAVGITGCGAAVVGAHGDATCQTTYSAAGSHPVTATYSGDASFQASPSAPLTQTIARFAATVALESSGDPSDVGDQVTYTATVSPTPTGGTIGFTDGGAGIADCGTVPVGAGGNATCPVTYSAVGTHPVAAAYSGGGELQAATSATVTQAVQSAATTTGVASSDNPSQAGQQVTYTAAVSPVPDGGTIAFTEGSSPLTGCGSVAVDGSGHAACHATYAGLGTHPISAAYSGDTNNRGSTSTAVAQVVGTAPSATTVRSSGDPSPAGSRVTYTASVSPAPAGGTIAFADGAAGITGCDAVALDVSGNATCAVTYPAVGSHSIVATYTGDATTQGSASAALGQAIAKALDTTTLSSATNPSAARGNADYTATVSPIPSGGTIAFNDTGTAILGCEAVAVDANGHATCQTTYPAVGSHSIVAAYSGDDLRRASTSPTLTQTVARAATVTTLRSSGDPSGAGDRVTLTATVAPIPAGGTIAVTDGAGPVSGCAAVAVDANGTGTCQATYSGVGSHPLTATYSGDANDQGSASAVVTQTVAAAATTTALGSSGDPSGAGDQVTYIATVSPTPGGGAVAFSDAGSAIPGCNAVAVSGNGGATCQATYTATGSHSITATYSGDANERASASAALTQTIEGAATTTALESSGDPSGAGGQVVYTATVSPTPAGGTVTFTDGGAGITGCGPVTVDGSGRATCRAAYATVGSHAILATYSGDGSHRASASAPFTQAVVKAVTVTGIASSGDPSPAGRQVTYTATVSPTPAGGTVAFADSGTTISGCGAVALDRNGQATCQTTYPVSGSRSVVATYSGDADHRASASRTLSLTIGQAPTATALTSSANPSAAGGEVTYTAAVAPAPAGGTIAFTDAGDGITGCTAVPVDGHGRATCQTSYAGVGSHPILAVYSGDGDDRASASRPLTQTVAKAPTTTTLHSSADPSAAGGQVTFTATVTPIPMAGTIVFTDGGDAITGCEAEPVDGAGEATCRATYPEAGSHTVMAGYSGDADSTGSISAPLTQLVAAPALVTTIKAAARRRIRESYPAVSAAYMAWSHTSLRRPHHYNLYEQAMSSNHPTGRIFRVNPARSFAYAGGISGTRLAYAQVTRGQSDIRFWNLAHHHHSSPGPGVNTKAWEISPTITASWLLFGRVSHRATRILLYNLKTRQLRVLAAVPRFGGRAARPGQVSGKYATYRTCRATCTLYRYNIATGHAAALPRPPGESDLVSAVSSIGTVYFIQGGPACDGGHALMQQTLGGAVIELKAFSPQVGIGKLQTYSAAGGRTQLFYSRTICAGRAVRIYRLSNR